MNQLEQRSLREDRVVNSPYIPRQRAIPYFVLSLLLVNLFYQEEEAIVVDRWYRGVASRDFNGTLIMRKLCLVT